MIVQVAEKRNVLEAAKERIKSAFETCPKIVLSISGGKDSIVLNDIMFKLAQSGQIDKTKMEVWFIDEEAMYDSVIDAVKQIRLNWLSIGVKFRWYCFQNRHYNCLNSLTEEESFICWDKSIPDKWVRERPSFSINDDECLDDKHENYQSWFEKKLVKVGAVCMIGVRGSESVQRMCAIAKKKGISKARVNRNLWPIYDWKDNDIWYYIKENHLDFPQTYVELWQVGVPKNKLRISQFFALDTVQSLSRLVYIEPGLYDRIVKREPNAYLLLLYSGTDMFGGKDSHVFADHQDKRDAEDKERDYKAECIDILFHGNPRNRRIAYDEVKWKQIKHSLVSRPELSDEGWKTLYKVLLLGDHKGRTLKACLFDFKDKKRNK